MPVNDFHDPVGSADRTAALKEYYARYLQTVRGLREASVKHYLDA